MKQIKLKIYEAEKFDSIKNLLDKAISRTPDKILFKFKENKVVKEVTFKQFGQDVDGLGTALVDLGVDTTHVAMLGANSYKWLNVYLTMLKSKGVFVPIDKELPFADIVNVLEHSDAEVLFYDKKYEKDIIANKERLTQIKHYIGLDRTEDDENLLSFDEFLKKGKKLLKKGNREFADNENDISKLKMIVYTSGTTGMSKGVMLTESNLVNCIYYGLRRSTIYTRCLSILPYNHTYEAVVGILVAIYKNVTICINDSLKSVLKNLQLYKPEYIYVVPMFAELFYKKIWAGIREQKKTGMIKLALLLSNGLRKIGIDLRRKIFAQIHSQFGGELREIVCGGAPVRAEVGKFFNDIGMELINGYGISECSPLVSVNPINFNDCTTVGFPLECTQVRIDNADEDGIGEIMVKGATVMMGYYKQPELTKEVLSEDGWFNTGDYGRLTRYGQLVITGRKKNLIVLDNGKNIYPEEIEDYIQQIPYVKEVVVYGIKNAMGIEDRIAAEVFLDPEQTKDMSELEETTKKDIAQACSVLPVYKRISQVVIRDVEFEKTTSKKIKRTSIMGNK